MATVYGRVNEATLHFLRFVLKNVNYLQKRYGEKRSNLNFIAVDIIK